MTPDTPRLIEVAFPLKQASLNSVHEKNVRHGHISTLHIWPARRPLAACRAALIATLLPDPGDDAERKKLLERIGGRVVQRTRRKNGQDVIVEETEGGVLHWGLESSPDMDWFREEIRKVYGGRAPKVLDPFAGGGAIPLEAMRLGCEATAIDINPVAWFILKCTLEYPQKLAGQTRPLPKFAVDSPEFMIEYSKKALGLSGKRLEKASQQTQSYLDPPEADLSWHVRAWGHWVLERARKDLERFYPTIEGKPTVAYLWARTVTCKACRATMPLLKTRWLCKKPGKRVRLTMEPNEDKTGVIFGIEHDVPVLGGNAAQKRAKDKELGKGTMSRSGAACPLCGMIMKMEDLRAEGKAKRLGSMMTAVVIEGAKGKEYRLPHPDEIAAAGAAEAEIDRVFADVPFGVPEEPTPVGGGQGAGRAFSVAGYGMTRWRDLFTPRQLVALGTFVKHTRAARDAMQVEGYEEEWVEGVLAGISCAVGKLLDYENSLASWYTQNEQITHLFNRFALPMKWDFAEASPIAGASGSWESMLNSVAKSVAVAVSLPTSLPAPSVARGSVLQEAPPSHVVATDPPYYDAIPYSDTMDFFGVWLRRTLHGLSPAIDQAFRDPLAPKWDHEADDGELVDDASRFGGDAQASKAAYEDGMARAFVRCHDGLTQDGRLVIVFANKQPDAWETLVSAIIRAGFVVTASWPIETEMPNRTRGLSSAALASSVWLVCKKRPESARAGWDNQVLAEMRERIAARLHDFWDAGIRGPDFVWSATGPALEAYSKHPIVKKADEPGEVMSVSEFLGRVRRIVVDFVVGRVLSEIGAGEAQSELDEVTTYYLLHRHDYGMGDAPAGAVILYALSCGLSDSDLADRLDLLKRSGQEAPVTDEEAEDDSEDGEAEGDEEPTEAASSGGSTAKLKTWRQRTRKTMGYDAPGGRPVPLIDQAHRLMHLWREGDVVKVDEYIDGRGLRESGIFHQVLQALIELAPAGDEERSLLESISNHLGGRPLARRDQAKLDLE